MKKKLISLSIACLLISSVSHAQNKFPANGAAGIGTTSPNASSLLEVKSTTKGVLLPRMTKAQRDAIGSPVDGLLIYQTNNTPGFYYYKGSSWKAISVNNVRGLGDNLFIGSSAGAANSGGIGNIALGKAALNGNVDRIENIAIGDSSQFELGVGAFGNQAWYNTSIGSKSQRFSTTGTKNTSVGAYSLYNCVAGNDNVAIGYQAMLANKYNHFNVAIGEDALSAIKADNNVAVGYSAGSTPSFSSECTFIGNDADQTGTNSYVNATALGNAARTTGNAQVRVGNSSVSSIGGFVNFTNLSDGRFKKQIQENVPGLDFINKLKPVTYHLDVRGLRSFLHEGTGNESTEAKARIEKGIVDKEQILYSGFVAQDVEHAAQESGYDFSGVDKPQNSESLYGLRYAEFTVPLVKAVQELSTTDKITNDRMTKLEQENAELKATVLQMQECLQTICANQQKANLNGDATTSTQLSLSPNPTSDVVKIEVTASDKKALVVKIINASGKQISSFNASGNSTFEFNTTAISKGIYLVQLFNQSELLQTEKLIVQ